MKRHVEGSESRLVDCMYIATDGAGSVDLSQFLEEAASKPMNARGVVMIQWQFPEDWLLEQRSAFIEHLLARSPPGVPGSPAN